MEGQFHPKIRPPFQLGIPFLIFGSLGKPQPVPQFVESTRKRTMPLKILVPVLFRKYRKEGLFLLLNLAWILLVWFSSKQHMGEFVYLPFALIIGTIALENFKNLWLLMVAMMPMSVNLSDFVEGANLTFPTDLFAIMLVGLILVKMVSERIFYLRFFQHPILWILVAYMLWMLFTSINSHLPVVSFKALASTFWMFIAFYFLSVLVFHQPKNILYFFLLIAISFTMVVCIILFFYISAGRNPFSLRFNPMPFFNDHTVFGAFTATLVPIFVLFTFFGKFSKSMRVVWAIGLLFILMGLFFSYSRGAWMSTLVALFLMGIFMVRKWIARFALPLSVIVIGLVIFAYQNYQTSQLMKNDAVSRKSFYDHIASVTNWKTDDSNAERVNRWVSALRMWEDRPWMGYGPGTYAMVYVDYQESWYRTLVSTNRGDNGTAHNEFLLALSEQGIPGTVLIALVFLLPIGLGLRGAIRAKASNVRILYIGCSFGLVAYFLHAFVNNFMDQDKVGGTIFGMLAVITALDTFHLKNIRERNRAFPRSTQEA